MYHYILQISYDGTAYNGWQRLKDTPNTIQGRLETMLSALLPEPVTLRGSGRTDAGVHALAQTADFFCSTPFDPADLLQKANDRLPSDIRILSISLAPKGFHSRKSCVQKTYAYCISLDARPDVFILRYLYHPARSPLMITPCPDKLNIPDVSAMRKAAQLLTGTHDFSAFTTDKSDRSHIRTLSAIGIKIIQKRQSTLLAIIFTGDGFLYNMVRILAGTLLEIGYGKKPPEAISDILASGKRENAGPTLPSNALFLCRTDYRKGIAP